MPANTPRPRPRPGRRLLALLCGLVLLMGVGYWFWQQPGLATLHGHPGGVSSLAFSPDGTGLASGSHNDATARLWDVRRGQTRLRLAGYSGGVCCVAFSPDGRLLAVASDEDEVILKGASGWPSGHGYRRRGDRKVKLYDLATGSVQADLAGHTSSVMGLAFKPDGSTLATGSQDGTVKLWNLTTGEVEGTLAAAGVNADRLAFEKANGLAFSPDGKLLACMSGSQVDVWDTATRQELPILGSHSNWIQAMAFAPKGEVLATASSVSTVKLWQARTGQLLATLPSPQEWATAVAFSPDGSLLAVGSCAFPKELPRILQASGRLTLWSVATRQVLKTYRGPAHTSCCAVFSPDGGTLATGWDDGTIELRRVPPHP